MGGVLRRWGVGFMVFVESSSDSGWNIGSFYGPVVRQLFSGSCFLFRLQSGLTPLHLAAQEDKVNVAEILVNHGATLDPETKVELLVFPSHLLRAERPF